MSDSRQLALDFLAALKANEVRSYDSILDEEAGMILGRWDGFEIYRPRRRIVQRLMEEWSAWPDPAMETFAVLAEGDQASLEFRIQATENQRYVEHNRSAFLSIRDGRIARIHLYCPEPVPSARRKGWIAPASLTEAELDRLFESTMHMGDPREWIPPNVSDRMSLRGGLGGHGDPHPGSNEVGLVRWTAEEADRRIEETIGYHRDRNIGFQWFVGPYDTPADLCQRLERHGLVLAGDVATMARLGLEQLEDIPRNARLQVDRLDGRDEKAIEAVGQILKICFNMTDDQAHQHVLGMTERLQDERFHERDLQFLACLDGEPVGYGHLVLDGGIAFLGGAATLPQFRGQKIYSTLLRRRLEEAHSRGYHLAAIGAGPMSRPIVAHYGFKQYHLMYIYGWMPVMDLEVIKSLVPQ